MKFPVNQLFHAKIHFFTAKSDMDRNADSHSSCSIGGLDLKYKHLEEVLYM